MLEKPLIFLGVVVLLGASAQWIAWRLKLPSILLLLASGFLLGYLGDVDPDQVIHRELLFPVVSLAVALIMFEGGMTLRFQEIDKSRDIVFRLVTVGVLISWVLGAVACRYLLGASWGVSVITGAILTVTGPTVVGPMLRHIRPVKPIGSIIKWEGIVIDPIGAVLAVLVFEVVVGHGDATAISIALIKTIGVGFLLGLAVAYGLLLALRRYWLPDFLHVPVTLALVLGAFVAANQVAHESGLIVVTVMGVVIGNQKQVPVRHLLEFKENLQILLISCLFVVLAARIEPNDILQLGVGGIALLVVLILVVRPIAVFASTTGGRLNLRERLFLCSLAPRGIVAAAVSSIFALEIAQHHAGQFPDADMIVSVTFLVIVGTVTVYGLAAGPIARRLQLAERTPQGVLFAGASGWVRQIAQAVHDSGVTVMLIDTNYRNVAEAKMAGMPAACGSVVSDFVIEDVDLGGIGRLLAMTPNDDLNSLAATEYATVFDRAEVFQLPPSNATMAKRDKATHLQGRYLFDASANYGELAYRFASGGQVKKTKITEEFTFIHFREKYGPSALVLFVVSPTGKLSINPVDEPIEPQTGDTVIAIVDNGNS